MNLDDNKSRDFWKQVRVLYNEAADLPEDDQVAFLDRHCPDIMVRKELEALFEVRETSERFFESLSAGLSYLTDEEESDDIPPDTGRAGNYSIIKRIGRGGMGTVYLAERADEAYESRVAVKILRLGLDSEDILARFHIERQILARLNHPNITHLLDGGLTSDGRPYFVMEYIKGKPVTRYCDEKQLTLKQRLELFFQVCDALQYAHKNLVIHRDLKPGNILVTKEGQVKLLDFGIAKLLDDEAGASQTLARTGLRVMTPEYASPEQMRGHSINTASDVYQLGLVLYELLCGQTPFSFPDRSLLETERVILEEEPVKASQKIDSLNESRLMEVCRVRSATLKQLKRELKGDLDAILLKALQKEADRRFSTVAGLKEEISRYLHGLPVQSRGENIRYRAGKFLRRNKTMVSVVSCFIFSLLFLGFMIIQERNNALGEARKSDQIKDFMVDLMQSLDPSEVRGEPVSATLLLDRGADRVLESDHQDPEVRGELLLTMADVYLNLALLEPSQKLITAFFDHLENTPGDLELLKMRGRLQQALLYSNMGEYETALTLYDEIHSDLETDLRNEHELIAEYYSDYAHHLRLIGDLEPADSLFQLALHMHEELYEPGHRKRIRVMSRYAILLIDQGDLLAAKTLQEETLQAVREHFGDIHPETLNGLNNLSGTLILLEEYPEADSILTETTHLAQHLFEEQNTITTIIMQNHGVVKFRMGLNEEALELFHKTISIREESGTYHHPTSGFITISISNVLLELERYEEARTWAEESIGLFEYGLPPQHWGYDMARILLSEANVRLNQTNPEMLETVRNSYENLKDARGAEDSYTQRALSLLTELNSIFE